MDDVDADRAARMILQWARDGHAARIVTLGTEMVVHALHDRRFREIVNESALVVCDTVGVLAVARRRGATLRERVTGIELMERLCALCASEGVPIFLLGGAPGIAELAAARLQARYPGLPVAGTSHGYFPQEQSAEIARAVAASGARLLFVGMGSPRQEYWLAEHLEQTGCGAGIGVGGSFDVLAGAVRRAPPAWRRAGLEWLYRLVKEPSRWRRQMALPRFALLAAYDEAVRALTTRRRDSA